MIAVDSSVLIDMLFDGPDAEQSADIERRRATWPTPALSDVAMAEICSRGDGEQVRKTLASPAFLRTHQRNCGHRAGEMSKRYRRNGGNRSRIIAGFFDRRPRTHAVRGLITLRRWLPP